MIIEFFPPMLPTRPCAFCLALQEHSVFADFDVDPDGRVFAARVSFDGYGCCRAPADVGRMNANDSAAFLDMVARGAVDDRAELALRRYFGENREVFWQDALVDHDLL